MASHKLRAVRLGHPPPDLAPCADARDMKIAPHGNGCLDIVVGAYTWNGGYSISSFSRDWSAAIFFACPWRTWGRRRSCSISPR